jgi:putative heme-binding domain-containing protein
LQLAPTPEDKKMLLTSFDNAFKGRSLGVIPGELREAIAGAGGQSLALELRTGKSTRVTEALQLAEDHSAPVEKRSAILSAFGDVPYPAAIPVLLRIATTSKGGQVSVQKTAVTALQRYDEPGIADALISALPAFSQELRLAALNVLSSRPAWAVALVDSVKRAQIPARIIAPEIVDKLRATDSVAQTANEVFGPKIVLEKKALDAKLKALASNIQEGSGNPFEGQKQFMVACSGCHRLFGQGGQIGPDLTSYKRDDLDAMLMNVVNPSGEIREGYETVVIDTKDGRELSGFLSERYEDAIVLRELDGTSTRIAQKEIVSFKSAGRSLMPEGLLDGFEDQQIRDLFAYLRSSQPLVKQ